MIVIYVFCITARLKEFLQDFYKVDDKGKKIFKYAAQLTELAHREQV